MSRSCVEPVEMSSVMRCALAAFAVATLYSGAALYWHQARGGPKPVYFILLIVGCAVALLAADPHRPARFFRSPLLLWAYLYLLMSTAWALWRTTLSPMTDQALVDRYRSMAFVVALAILFDDQRARSVGRISVVAVALVAALVHVGEALGFIRFVDMLERTAGRAGGLYGNPNQAGLVIVFGVAVGITAVPRALRLPVVLVAACGVAPTFSRSAFLCMFVLVAVLLWRRDVSPWPTMLSTVGLAVALAWTGGRLEALLDSAGALNSDTLARLTFRADDSGRQALAARAWQMFIESPWVGHGMATERAGRISHNMYLSLAAEHGVLGLIAFPALVVAICLRHRTALAFGLVFLVAGFVGHNFLEQEPALLCVALAAARSRGSAPASAAAPATLGEKQFDATA
jgi:O-antigen ligase